MRAHLVSRSRFASFVVAALAAVGCQPAALRQPATPPPCEPVGPNAVCTADGIVRVRAADARRILVAVDTRAPRAPSDGLVDHLYLYTSQRPHGLFATDATFMGHVEYRDGELLVVGADGRPRLEVVLRAAGGAAMISASGSVQLEGGIGLSHYTERRGLRLARLGALRVAHECDGPTGSCLEVDGLRIRFPA